jgi:hypothetical protein
VKAADIVANRRPQVQSAIEAHDDPEATKIRPFNGSLYIPLQVMMVEVYPERRSGVTGASLRVQDA